jgi:site-specific DNA-cytosine methylase
LAVVVQKKSFPERVYSESEKHGTVLCGSNGSGAHKNLVKTDLILQRNYAQCVSMRGRHIDETGKRVDIKGAETVQRIESAVCEGKTNCITTVQKDNLVSFNTSQIRRLTPTEVCRLFNVPDDYFHDKDGNRLISESQQYKALGNGWVVDVIAHIFSFIPDALAL